MELSNFKLIEVIGSSPTTWKFRATVDVTTGWMFKKTETMDIYRQFAQSWYFANTGKYTPETQAEELEMALEAKQGKSIEDMGSN